MQKKGCFLFIVEGEVRETSIFENIFHIFFGRRYDFVPICVPAEMNIFMLYNVLKKDNFLTDVVEVLKENVPHSKEILKNYTRDDFTEIYYFFDFDEHTNNYAKKDNIDILNEMLINLNNETDIGKLYVSYPMIEALRDSCEFSCKTSNGSCLINRNEFLSYKNISSKNSSFNDVRSYNFLTWKNFIKIFLKRVNCLFNLNIYDRDTYLANVTPYSIFKNEIKLYSHNDSIFVLSCIPQFLIDYSKDNWFGLTKNEKKMILDCKDKKRFKKMK